MMNDVLRTGGFNPAAGGGGKPPRKSGNDEPGLSHEKEATTSNSARAAAKKLRKQFSETKSREVLASVEATDTEMKTEGNNEVEVTRSAVNEVNSF